MAAPLLYFVFDRRHIATQTKEAPVELRVIFERDTRYIRTGVKLHKNEWNFGTICRRADAPELQETLNVIMKRTRSIMNEMLADGTLTAVGLKKRVESQQEERYSSFLEYIQKRLEVKMHGKAEGTCKRYMVFFNFIVEYGKIDSFYDVNERNIVRLDEYLKKRGLAENSRWTGYHRFMNSFISDAISEGYIHKNPYKWLDIGKGETKCKDRYLTMEEFTIVRNCSPKQPYLQRVRDLFVFQTLTCLSVSDLSAFDYKKAKTINGVKIYTSKRVKTGQEFTVVLSKAALEILKRYKYHLPTISDAKYNKFLKELASLAGIDKPLSSHWARHTGATLLLNTGHVDMEVISHVLGHSSVRETRNTYAKMLNETIVAQLADVDL